MAMSKAHFGSGKERREAEGAMEVSPRPELVRLSFHASMGKADTCLDRDDPFNHGIEDMHDEMSASYGIFGKYMTAFQTFVPVDAEALEMWADDHVRAGQCMTYKHIGWVNGEPQTCRRKYWFEETDNRGRANLFEFSSYNRDNCASFVALSGITEDEFLLARLDRTRTEELMCRILTNNLFHATVHGPAECGKALPAEALMSMPDYFNFQYVQAIQDTIPPSYKSNCAELCATRDICYLRCDLTHSIQYLKRTYGRTYDASCPSTPTGDQLPSGSQNFNHNIGKMQNIFQGINAQNFTILMGAHTLGGTHKSLSGFRDGTWSNNADGLNVNFFYKLHLGNWKPLYDADTQTTTFRQTAELSSWPTGLMYHNDDRTVHSPFQGVRHLYNQSTNQPFIREFTNTPSDVGLMYNFELNADGTVSNLLLRPHDSAQGSPMATVRSTNNNIPESAKSPGFAIVHYYFKEFQASGGSALFIKDFLEVYGKMINNGYVGDFGGGNGSLSTKTTNELYDACNTMYQDETMSVNNYIDGVVTSRLDWRLENCHHLNVNV